MIRRPFLLSSSLFTNDLLNSGARTHPVYLPLRGSCPTGVTPFGVNTERRLTSLDTKP